MLSRSGSGPCARDKPRYRHGRRRIARSGEKSGSLPPSSMDVRACLLPHRASGDFSLPSLLQIPVRWQTVQPVKSPAHNIGAQSASGISPASRTSRPAKIACRPTSDVARPRLAHRSNRGRGAPIVSHIALDRRARATPEPRSRRWLQTLNDAMREQGIVGAESGIGNRRQSMVWGFYRPVLLLPAAGDDWSENERRHALLHELAHIRRHDYLSDVIASLLPRRIGTIPLLVRGARSAQPRGAGL